jgi:hypothetical protein
MKQFLQFATLAIALSLSVFAQDAPKAFPTKFLVEGAMSQDAKFMGPRNICQMDLRAADQVYFVTAVQPFGVCHMFPQGTTVYGDLKESGHNGAIYLLDTTGNKPKARKYRVENVHPAPEK